MKIDPAPIMREDWQANKKNKLKFIKKNIQYLQFSKYGVRACATQ
jgi:hypothetical protein